MTAIYSKYDDVTLVAQRRESDRSLTSLCLRALLEMAICECPEAGGAVVNDEDVSDLLSLCALLVNTASDSDAIHCGLVEPEVQVKPNGTYIIPTDVMEEVVNPYLYGHFQNQFEGAIESYGELYDVNEIPRSKVREGVWGVQFDEALMAEYSFAAHQLVECWAEMLEMHADAGQMTLFLSEQDLVDRISENRQLDKSCVSAFLEAFSLHPRERWDSLPSNISFRDIAPWKYKRRLSCLVKPIIRLNNGDIASNLFLIKQGMAYFLDRASKGEFNTEFFSSEVMRSYVGMMIEKRGADFTASVASRLESDGWFVKNEVLMTTLGAPQKLGDIDVLAIKDGVLLVIECKNLQMAKTASEIADVCNRFQGNGTDELRKHMNRAEWVSDNMAITAKAIGYQGEVRTLRGTLLTSTEMPMAYKNDLPMSNEDIISL